MFGEDEFLGLFDTGDGVEMMRMKNTTRTLQH
jgi:hypothetical protein